MKTMFRLSAIALATGFAFAAPASAGYTSTKNPIMLVHGIFGFNNFLGADYFYGVKDTLSSEGAVVYTSTVSAAGSNETRGEQLRSELRRIRAASGNPNLKFNLIGHSQGSPTVRYVAAVEPGLVASVTSVGGVNKGSKVADIVRKVAPAGTVTETVANSVGNAFAALMAFATGSSELPQSSIDALNSLTTPGLAKFNAKYPAGVPTSACGEGAYSVNGIKYYSWGGKQAFTNALDPMDAGISTLSLAFAGSGEESDGLVGVCSQRLGKVISVSYKMNHLDEVNGFFGIVHLFETNPKSLYRAHANRLQAAGL